MGTALAKAIAGKPSPNFLHITKTLSLLHMIRKLIPLSNSKNNPCGAQNPTRVNTSTITTHTQTATGSATGSGSDNTAFATLGGSSPSGSSSSSSGGGSGNGGVSGNGAGQLAIDIGRTYGLAVVLGSVFAGFMLVL